MVGHGNKIKVEVKMYSEEICHLPLHTWFQFDPPKVQAHDIKVLGNKAIIFVRSLDRDDLKAKRFKLS